jgi:hypothetical protein
MHEVLNRGLWGTSLKAENSFYYVLCENDGRVGKKKKQNGVRSS